MPMGERDRYGAMRNFEQMAICGVRLTVVRNDGQVASGLPAKIILRLHIFIYELHLKATNLFSKRSILGAGDVDVSLTTFGDRTFDVWKTVETIGSGTLKPRMIFLWHEDEMVVQNPPRTLRRLVKRGLTLRHCENFGPHKKYFPYVTEEIIERPLVTADDDVLYPATWLDGLMAARGPVNEVLAYRARVMTDGPYEAWPMCSNNWPSANFFATGVSGVLYPPAVLLSLRERGAEFMYSCPKADDFWLHYAAVASGIETRQVSKMPATWWPLLPRRVGLEHSNVLRGGNDAVRNSVRKAWLGQ